MDFALILFLLSVVTGILWCIDVFYARKRRQARAKTLLGRAADARRGGEHSKAEMLLTAEGISQSDARNALRGLEGPDADKVTVRLPDPWWVEYGASFFAVILPIFLLRSFWIEPFRIPSGSMIPTLLVGDFILVNKYTYGVRLPVLNKKVIEVGSPQRGDVFVFRYPYDTTQDYIKRVIGVPGDKVAYINKRLTINGQQIPVRPHGDYLDPQTFGVSQAFEENLNGKVHQILNDRDAPAFVPEGIVKQFPHRENCTYSGEGVTCTVPAGYYFAMGDNRDQSADSRMWGFVPDENIVGKAFFIWFHADSILPPRGIRFDRIGSFN
ncbi:signal peptidase I [Uliginosibacterium sp. sgz301328]|uniref:signal peptidase I n=1 Tax=Uliginosibacterium sp. sgz301328 TaxID=3243764 RepID=UPI00359EB05B